MATSAGRTGSRPPDESGPRPSGAVQASWLDNQSLVSPAHQLRLDEPLLLDGGRTLPEYVVNFETLRDAVGRAGQRHPGLPFADQPGARGGPPRA